MVDEIRLRAHAHPLDSDECCGVRGTTRRADGTITVEFQGVPSVCGRAMGEVGTGAD